MNSLPIQNASAHPVSEGRSLHQKSKSLEGEKARLRKAAEEFESFFLYYMLKTMRQSIPKDATEQKGLFAEGLGKETFRDMFDMELSRKMRMGNNKSLSAILYQSVEKTLEARFGDKVQPANAINLQRVKPMTLRLDQATQPIEIQLTDKKPFTLETETRKVQTTSQVESIKARFGTYIEQASEATKLDSALIAAVITVESSGRTDAESPRGALGLMQLMPKTAGELGVSEPRDPAQNIKGGSRYLRSLFDRFGDLKLALAAYNAGPEAVAKYGGVPPYPETQQYVEKVIRSYFRNQSLYAASSASVKIEQ